MRTTLLATAAGLALLIGASFGAEIVAPSPSPAPLYALGIIAEDAWVHDAPFLREAVVAFAANTLQPEQCEVMRDALVSAGGFAACFADGADESSLDAPELRELDPVACRIADAEPTDANLRACFGEVRGAMW